MGDDEMPSARETRLSVQVAALRENQRLMAHLYRLLIAAIATDHLYTTCYWLILGRDERRNSKHAELKYFALLAQLSLEAAAIVHLVGQLRKVQP